MPSAKSAARGQKPEKGESTKQHGAKQIMGTWSGRHRLRNEGRPGSMGVARAVRGEHIDSARLLRPCHGLAVRQFCRWGRGT